MWACAIKERRGSELDELGAEVKNWLTSGGRFGEIGDPAVPLVQSPTMNRDAGDRRHPRGSKR